MTRLTRHSASAALEMRPDGVLIVRLYGPLTLDALQHFKACIVDLHGPQIRAFVADYRHASVAATGAELDAVLEGEPDESAPTMPAAMVIPELLLPVFREHARRMAARAIVRRLFLHQVPAVAWATKQAALEHR